MKLIVARAINGVIGRDNGLPWPRIEGDLERFKRLTLGHAVVMGRKTWESLPKKPLGGRMNIVLSRSATYELLSQETSVLWGPAVVDTLQKAQALADSAGCALWCIGGAQVYSLALASGTVEEMHVTQLHAAFPGDTYLTDAQLHERWRLKSFQQYADHDYEVWTRR